MQKPDRIFARDGEWDALTRFASGTTAYPGLGVVSGRRRQGKTFLLESLADLTGGLYFGAIEATETESLALFAAALGRHLGQPSPPRFETWDEAIRYLFGLDPGAGPFVIDEFPYLTKGAPALPSIIQREVDRAAFAQHPIRLLLCGSAMSVMGGLLAGNAPLRGRATLELIVRPFEYWRARQFWEVEDPRLAVLLHSVVGGTPAYRNLARDDRPR